MKKYIKDFFNGIIHGSIKKKILTILVLMIYIFILLICIIPLKVSSTSPGTITSVATVIDIDGADVTNVKRKAYTVSVYTKTKASILEYWISLLDKNTEMKIDKRENTIYTVSEEEKIDVIAKEQSIQDSLITAYDTAKLKGYDVNLEKTYKGIKVACMPQNYLKTGPESLQIGDIVTKIEDTEITNIDTFKEKVIEISDNYDLNIDKNAKRVEIIRNNNPLTLENCDVKSLVIIGRYIINYNFNVPEYVFFEYYELDSTTAKPKFKINKAFSSGPSGGLIQTLFVYDCITGGSIIKDNYILGTGTISRDGSVGEIGGINQKILTANYYQCKYFFVPTKNYDEALKKYYEIKDPSFVLVKVNTFMDAINFLESEGGN